MPDVKTPADETWARWAAERPGQVGGGVQLAQRHRQEAEAEEVVAQRVIPLRTISLHTPSAPFGP